MNVAVPRWAAWAPGLEEPGAWQRWSDAPTPLTGDGTPDVRFLPPLVRRRCSALARLMLHVAHACTTAAGAGQVPTVFASRHGDCAGALDLMTDLAHDAPITAAAFSHSVHNTAAGLHSIVTRNAHPSTSTAGGIDTFASGVIEALGLLERSAAGRVLLVVGDVPLPAPFASFVAEPIVPYAVGVLLTRGGADDLEVRFEGGTIAARPWPDAVEFLRWLLSPAPAARIAGRRTTMRWSRRGSPAAAGNS